MYPKGRDRLLGMAAILILVISGSIAFAQERVATDREAMSIVEKYLRAWSQKDWSGMYSCLHERIRSQLSIEQFKECFAIRIPASERVDYQYPVRWKIVRVLRVQGDQALVVECYLDYTRESFLGSTMADLLSPLRRRIATNEERYRMRVQAALLLAHLYNERSPYLHVLYVVHAYVAPYVQAFMATVRALEGDKSSDANIIDESFVCGAGGEVLSPADLRAIEAPDATGVRFVHTSAPAAICVKPLVVREVNGRWLITNAVIPATDALRREWLNNRLQGSAALPSGTIETERLDGFLEVLIARELGVFD